MKSKKGEAGYLSSQKKRCIVKTVIEFGVVIALLILGIVETGSRMNLLTVAAILGCLPASKSLVAVIMLLPHHSIECKISSEIDEKAEHILKIYDMVFTSERKIMPVDAIVIHDNTICGYTSKEKVDTNFASKHLKEYLVNNGFSKASVKIFNNYNQFLERAESLSNFAKTEKAEGSNKEIEIRQVILNLSL